MLARGLPSFLAGSSVWLELASVSCCPTGSSSWCLDGVVQELQAAGGFGVDLQAPVPIHVTPVLGFSPADIQLLSP